eukprot:7789172-Pyramimonas_sp.AAC.1
MIRAPRRADAHQRTARLDLVSSPSGRTTRRAPTRARGGAERPAAARPQGPVRAPHPPKASRGST